MDSGHDNIQAAEHLANPGSATNAVTAASGYDTGYSYDVLDNLTRVRQFTMGDRSTYQERVFVYDSLSRLRSETHPESGTASYQYDANGNLKLRTDARGISTTYSYDSLDRLTTTLYSDGTPATTVTYDQGANGKGRLATASGGRFCAPSRSTSVKASFVVVGSSMEITVSFFERVAQAGLGDCSYATSSC